MNATFPSPRRLAPFILPQNRAYFLRCYAETWRIAHGDLRGFNEETIYDMYLRRWEREPEGLLGLWLEDEGSAEAEPAGLLGLDGLRGPRLLWISFLHVSAAHRRQGLGSALLEAAAAKARELGREELQLCTAKDNPALYFFGRQGFHVCGREPGAVEPLLRLRKPVAGAALDTGESEGSA